MAILRDFCDFYKTHSSRSAQSTPPQQNSGSQLRFQNNEKRFLSDEVRGSRQFRTYTTSEQMLGILHKDKKVPKDFSRYTRLPAIGNSGAEYTSKPSFNRQLTYTVFNPIFVKGPTEPAKGPRTIQPDIKKSPQKVTSKKKRLLPNRKRAQDDIARELEERKRRVQERFSRSVHGNRIQVSEDLVNANETVEEESSSKTKGLFWIQF